MRRTALLGVVIWCLLSQTKSECDISGGIKTDKEFPDIFSQSYTGYQLTTEFSNKKTRETVIVNEYYDIVEKSGKLDIYRNGNFKQFVYLQKSDEAFTISGSNCETAPLLSSPPFLEDGPYGWLDYEDDFTLLGPSATIRQAYLAWKKDKMKVVYIGNINEDRSIVVDRWRQCVKDATVEYYFSDPTWHNAYNFSNMRVPLRVKYITATEDQTLEFYNYQSYISQPEHIYDVPEGYGCNRTADNEEDVPELGARNHLLRGEMVYHSIDMDAKKYSRFISTFQIAYHSTSDMIAYSYAPWKKGATDKDGTIKTQPFTRIVWDNRNNILYEMNLDTRTCTLNRDSEYYPSFELPGENDGNIDLLDPNILISTDGFKYLGDRKERGIPVYVFEKQVKPMFLGDREAAVGVITRTYSTKAAIINTGNKEIGSPVRITISWYDDEEKTKLKGVLVVNIFSYSNDVPFIHDYFDVRMCFRDYDASMWFKIIFPNMGVTKQTLIAHSREIESEFLGVLYTHTETTPVRVPRVLVDVNDEDFSVEAMILERPTYYVEFDPRGGFEIQDWNASYGIVSEEECLKNCVEYSTNTGESCRAVSFCGASCYISTVDKPTATENKECKLYDRAVISKSLPSMDQLARSIRKSVAADEFALSFPINAGDEIKLVTFKAGAFGDSLGDTRERRRPQLLRDEKFKVSLPGMKLNKGEKDLSKPVGKFSISSCLQVCLNNPYCETVSYCRGTECVVSEDFISDISLDRTVKNNKCIILARNYLQAYKAFPGVTLSSSAKKTLNAKNPDGCANACTKEGNFQCRSFDFCEEKDQCLLHSTHFLELKKKGEGMQVKENCTHFSMKYVYDFKMILNRRAVGEAELKLQHNNVEECAQECIENGGFDCTAFDFCEGVETIDNKCFLISTVPDQIKTVERTDCRHYLNQGIIGDDSGEKPKKQAKKYSTGLAGGLGFLFFLIGSAFGVGGTYFFAYKYANKG